MSYFKDYETISRQQGDANIAVAAIILGKTKGEDWDIAYRRWLRDPKNRQAVVDARNRGQRLMARAAHVSKAIGLRRTDRFPRGKEISSKQLLLPVEGDAICRVGFTTSMTHRGVTQNDWLDGDAHRRVLRPRVKPHYFHVGAAVTLFSNGGLPVSGHAQLLDNMTTFSDIPSLRPYNLSFEHALYFMPVIQAAHNPVLPILETIVGRAEHALGIESPEGVDQPAARLTLGALGFRSSLQANNL